MAEYVDEWAASGRNNTFGDKVLVQEMQSEGGAAAFTHGALLYRNAGYYIYSIAGITADDT